MDDERGSLGGWLADLRERAGLTQEQLSQNASVKKHEIERYENGRSQPGALPLLRLFSALHVSVDPPPPGSLPRALNVEVAALRQAVEQFGTIPSLDGDGSDVIEIAGDRASERARSESAQVARLGDRLEELVAAVEELTSKVDQMATPRSQSEHEGGRSESRGRR